MQVIHLQGKDDDSSQNKRVSLTNTVCESKYDGCKSGENKEWQVLKGKKNSMITDISPPSPVPLPL